MRSIELDRDGGPPLWCQVQDDLRRRIDAGEFTERFPGEKVLARTYGVSRQTMRQSLRALRESGVVSARRGKAPQVQTDVIEQPMGALYSLFASVEGAGKSQHSRVLALDRRRDPPAAEHLGLDPQAELVHLARIRLADGTPLALDRVWLPAAIAAPLLEADFTHTALYREMAERIGDAPRQGQEVIQAVTLSAADAQQLEVPAGAAAFHIERLGLSGARTLEWRTTVVRGDRFRVSSQFSPSAGFRWGFDTHAAGDAPDRPGEFI